MSASTTTAAQAELIDSLTQDEIPIKLRCAICSRLAVNAFRLPCCEQAICESCQSTLPSSCPVCEHTPVSAEDCKPNKSLRTTIKVFLRTEEKKREAARLKEAKASPPATPLVVETPALVDPTPAEIIKDAPPAEIQAEEATPAEQIEQAPAKPADEVPAAQQDIPHQSIEEIAPGQESMEDGDVDKTEEKAENDAKDGEGVSQTPAFGAGMGFDPSVAGGFPGMGFGGDMTQMMQMMAMQNGMGAGGFGNFPMMGMPGMGMDPMSMQNAMMNGGGFGANGMGMNMGMGMAGFDGGMGTGFNNGWNGQQNWNVGTDNFNHPNAAAMGHGDYGSNNSGYSSHSAGYNQSNYGRGNHHNDYSQGYRGRGRGRGGYSRGGYGYGSNEAFSQQYPQQFGSGQQRNGPISETGSIPTGPKADATPAPAGNTDEFGREIRPKSEGAEDSTPKNDSNTEGQNGDKGTENAIVIEGPSEFTEEAATVLDLGDKGMAIQTLEDNDASYAQEYNSGFNSVNSYGAARGGFAQNHSRGGNFGAMQPPNVKPVDVPINAPTGPKAMRAADARGRGFPIAGHASSRPNTVERTSVPPEQSEKEGRDRERTRSPSRDRDRSPSLEKRRSRSRSREKHHRRHRHRSASRSEDERDSERRRDRRRERRRREEEEGGRGDEGDEVVDDTKTERIEDNRSRSASPSEFKRASHRSRRDRDKYREREKASDRDHKSSSHKHRSNHRSHRDDRSRSRDRDRDREHRHRHSRRGSEELKVETEKVVKQETGVAKTPAEPEAAPRRPSAMSNGFGGIEIKGASSRNKSISISEDIRIPTGPRQDRISSAARDRERERPSSARHRHNEEAPHHSSRRDSGRDRDRERERGKENQSEKPQLSSAPPVQDPHTLEREKRNRERLLKEAQRMAGLTAGMGGRKHSRDEGDDVRKGRKKGRRGGMVTGDDEEARLARLEAERENARWN
ncbi:hypothetical protein LSUB1_G004733 [Lachnellula subtilissima]|uniref:RING-type domain-containing protein n=1 Tax=Lachnellula subtilissima TaxID=602034 RepID=A0A8H8RPC2_9HELO|nr:hypothetical protein LSUB1_G004733 [Lachnellula subtilissima]